MSVEKDPLMILIFLLDTSINTKCSAYLLPLRISIFPDTLSRRVISLKWFQAAIFKTNPEESRRILLNIDSLRDFWGSFNSLKEGIPSKWFEKLFFFC